MTDWQDLIVGDRMAVDREFSARVADSEFTSQQWSLVMTATEFRVVDAEDPEAARLVADTSKVEGIVPELEEIDRQAGPMGAAGSGGRGGSDRGSGIIGSVKDALGMGGSDGDPDTEAVVRRADRLTGEYADLLQQRLENEDKWERVRSLAAGESPTGASDTEETGADPGTAGTDDEPSDGEEPTGESADGVDGTDADGDG